MKLIFFSIDVDLCDPVHNAETIHGLYAFLSRFDFSPSCVDIAYLPSSVYYSVCLITSNLLTTNMAVPKK